MAENALKILRDEEVLEEFKQKAFKVASNFDIQNVLPLYEALYEKAFKEWYKTAY